MRHFPKEPRARQWLLLHAVEQALIQGPSYDKANKVFEPVSYISSKEPVSGI